MRENKLKTALACASALEAGADEVQVQVGRDYFGILHEPTQHECSTKRKLQAKHVELGELVDSALCTCLTRALDSRTSTHFPTPNPGLFILKAGMAAAELDVLEARDSGTGRVVGVERLKNLQERVRSMLMLSKHVQSTDPRAREAAALSETILVDAKVRLEQLATGGRTRARVLARVRCEMEKSGSRTLVLDETPFLVSLSPLGHQRKSCEELLAVTQLRRDGYRYALALMPRYAYDFLQRSIGLSAGQDLALQGAAAPADPGVFETVVSLWDPSSDGPLGDLHGALEAASAL